MSCNGGPARSTVPSWTGFGVSRIIFVGLALLALTSAFFWMKYDTPPMNSPERWR